MRSLGSSVNIVTWLRAGRPRNCDSISGGLRAFPSLHIQTSSGPTHPIRYWRHFPLEQNYFSLQLTTHVPLLRRLRMNGTVPPRTLFTYCSIECVGTNLRVFTLSNDTHVYICRKKSLLLARLYGGCDRFGAGGCNRRRKVKPCSLV